MTDYLTRIGTLIRSARQHRGWTQQQLAEAVGVSRQSINSIERHRYPDGAVWAPASPVIKP